MIIINNEEALRVNCTDAEPSEIGPIIQQLESELLHSSEKGIGLAAPQIGIAKNVAIVRAGKHNINLVNCKIDKKFDPAIFETEGCLSFPGRYEKTRRYQEITIVDNAVEPFNFVATGLLSVVCQHELDHTLGILLPDVAIVEKIASKKVRPNDLCPCKSGLKYKKCCRK